MLAKCVENCGFERFEGVLKANYFDKKGKVADRKKTPREFFETFGSKNCVIGHMIYPGFTDGNKIIFITRNPLDWAISMARYKTKDRPTIPSRESVAYIIENKMRILFGFVGWLYKADLVVKFEDLIANNQKPLVNIRNLLGVNIPLELIGSHINLSSRTYTGVLSNHVTYFDSELRELFEENHGGKLMELFGYA
jgi:hypothetical protein